MTCDARGVVRWTGKGRPRDLRGMQNVHRPVKETAEERRRAERTQTNAECVVARVAG